MFVGQSRMVRGIAAFGGQRVITLVVDVRRLHTKAIVQVCAEVIEVFGHVRLQIAFLGLLAFMVPVRILVQHQWPAVNQTLAHFAGM